MDCSLLVADLRFKKHLRRFNMFLFRNPLLFIANIKQQYKNSKLKIVAPTWNDVFELSNGSYSVSDIQDLLGTS